MILAIFQSERVYEGNTNFLTTIYPMPSVSKVTITAPAGLNMFSFGSVSPIAPPIFREDSFDPTTRIRRGRFYLAESPNRRDYPAGRVNHYPYAPPIAGGPAFYSFESYNSLQAPSINRSQRPFVFLGEGSHQTAWRIVGLERLFNGETLVTLKSADTLGLLPELSETALPAEKRRDISDAIEKVADASQKYLPVPIVDVCRETTRVLLTAWLSSVGVKSSGDLADVIKQVPGVYECVRASARIINRLHSRGKSSEQERQAQMGKDLRDISPADAELSVALVGFLLRETGWEAG